MSVSVIVPTLDEARGIAQTVRRLRSQRPLEIIVVDGGSNDATCEQAAAADLLLHSSRGRAAQMNLGAVHARGEVLLFLHADCWLEAGALAEAERCLATPRVAGGCFRMAVEANGFWYRLIGQCATARVRLAGLIYGDQGLFLRRDLFHQLGGFPCQQFMEDLSFSQLLRQAGRLVVASRQVFVSPRRWQQRGLVRQTLRNWTLTALAASGMSPDELARFYPPVR
jgi:rSAM/selenodomain-associated transferase 2